MCLASSNSTFISMIKTVTSHCQGSKPVGRIPRYARMGGRQSTIAFRYLYRLSGGEEETAYKKTCWFELDLCIEKVDQQLI